MTSTSSNTRTDDVARSAPTPEIDGCRQLHRIGDGGSSTVFRATTEDGTLVAIKLLHNSGHADSFRRFDREVEVMKSLDGVDGVVPLLGTATSDTGAPCLVIPYYPAGSLADLMESGGPLDPEHARRVVLGIARVLSEVHERGVYHRDLKPANVLLDDAMQPWIGDFGVAQQSDHHTVSTTVSYTLGYCPPEAFLMGRHGSNGVAVDVYALAATLWALIAGRAPFSDPAANVESRSEESSETEREPLASLERPSPDTSDALAEVIARATDRDPGRRPSSMAAFADLLEQASRASAGPVHPDPHTSADDTPAGGRTISRPGDEATAPTETDAVEPKRHVAKKIAVGAAAALVAASAAWVVTRPDPQQWTLVASNGASSTFHLTEPGEGPTAENELSLNADWIAPLSTNSDPEIAGGDTIFAVVGSAAGESLAVVDVPDARVDVIADNRLARAWAFDDRAILEEQSGAEVRCVSVSPSGGQRQLGVGTSCEPSPQGRHVAITSGDAPASGADADDPVGQVTVVRSSDGAVVARVDGIAAEQSAGWSAFAPDDAYFAIRGRDAVVSVFDLEAGTEIDRLSIRPVAESCDGCLAWNANGSLIGIDAEAQEVELWRRNADPIVLDGYTTAAFRTESSDDVLLWSDDATLSMLDQQREVLDVSDSAHWIVADNPASPIGTTAGALLIDEDEVLVVEDDASTTTVATLSAPVVAGSNYRVMRVGDTTVASFEVNGGRDVVAFDHTTTTTWTAKGLGADVPVEFIKLGDAVVATITPADGDDRLLLVEPTGIDVVEVAGEVGALAGFGDDVYFTRDGQDLWLDRLDRHDGEVEAVLKGHEVVAFGTTSG